MLDQTALKNIEAEVKKAEQATSGQIVVVIAPRSAGWSGVRTAVAFSASAIMGLLLALVVETTCTPAGSRLAGCSSLVPSGSSPGSGPSFGRAPAGNLSMTAVLRAAKSAFVDHGVHATKTRAGVLIFVSMLEHRVRILGDAGVHALIGDDGWASYAREVSAALKRQNPSALIEVIQDIGAKLATAFPRAVDDETSCTTPSELTARRDPHSAKLLAEELGVEGDSGLTALTDRDGDLQHVTRSVTDDRLHAQVVAVVVRCRTPPRSSAPA